MKSSVIFLGRVVNISVSNASAVARLKTTILEGNLTTHGKISPIINMGPSGNGPQDTPKNHKNKLNDGPYLPK